MKKIVFELKFKINKASFFLYFDVLFKKVGERNFGPTRAYFLKLELESRVCVRN